jgi:signal peptidase I
VAGPLTDPGRGRALAGTVDHPAAPHKSVFREYTEALAIAVVLALVIRTFLVQAYKIPSGSMEPTLLIGDHILVNKMIYGLRVPDSFLGLHPLAGEVPYGHYLFRLEPIHRGDVIVFVFPPDPTKDFIKRVIALAGDTVEVRDRAVYINGQRQTDPHAYYQPGIEGGVQIAPRDHYGPVKVPEHDIFVMGDNRDRSYDSRFWGFVDEDEVEGRAMIIYWSWDSDSSSWLPIRWSRFGKLIE